MTGQVLDAIVASARQSADAREHACRRAEFEVALERAQPRARAFRSALTAPGVRVIAECKRRSPARGVLRSDYSAETIAAGYEKAGAAAVSVITEPTFFDGAMEHLTAVRAAVSVPVLRKDFLVTPFQIAEARAIGADAVLLIAAVLTGAGLAEMLAVAAQHELAALVEVHDAAQCAAARDAGATIVGVNCRDLRTLTIRTEVFDELAALLPEDTVMVAESGLRSAADLRRLAGLGYRAFLIGERLMTEADPGLALAQLVADARAEPS